MGGTSVAAAVSVTTMAAVFGGAGAGLTGYKMLKRTRGLQEFEFEQHDRKGSQLAVMIMVSGWIEERDDYKRVFGVLPDRMTLLERLGRYYQLYCPERLQSVQEEAAVFEDCPDQLFDKLRSLYGKDPLSAEDLLPAYPEPAHDDLLQSIINHSIDPSSEIAMSENELRELNARHYRQSHRVVDSSSDSNSSSSEAESLSDQDLRSLTLPTLTAATTASDTSSAELSDAVVPLALTTDQLVGIDDSGGEELSAADNIFGAGHFWSWRELEICPLYELHLLRWELSLQQDLGHSIIDMLKSLSSAAVQNVLAYTVFAAMASAVLWPVALLKLTDMIDGLWTIAVERADLAGRELAKALMARPAGSRPVTLVGYSLGARVIFSCLKHLSRPLRAKDPSEELSHRTENDVVEDAQADEAEDADSSSDEGSLFEREQVPPSAQSISEVKPSRSRLYFFRKSSTMKNSSVTPEPSAGTEDVQSIVQDVVLLGAPVSLSSRYWKDVRKVVAGRLVNGYSANDKVLSIVYRYQRFKVGVSGIAPVTVTAGVENVNLSGLVDQHVDYCRKMKQILTLLDLSNCSEAPLTTEETGGL